MHLARVYFVELTSVAIRQCIDNHYHDDEQVILISKYMSQRLTSARYLTQKQKTDVLTLVKQH